MYSLVLDSSIAVQAFIHSTMALAPVKKGLRHPKEGVEFKQQYFSENEPGNFKGILFMIQASRSISWPTFTFQVSSIEAPSILIITS